MHPDKKESNLPAVIHTCKNCGQKGSGYYCSNCGQDYTDYNRLMREIFRDFIGILSLDRSIFKTIKPFLFQPGKLTVLFFEGKRKTYLSPVRLYMFLSIVFFFVVRMTIHPDEDTKVHVGDYEESSGVLADTAFVHDGDSIAIQDSLLILNGDTVSVEVFNKFSEKFSMASLAGSASSLKDFIDSGDFNSIIDTLNSASADSFLMSNDSLLTESIDDETEVKEEGTDSEDEGKDNGINEDNAENVKQFSNLFLQNSSYALFLLMPLFALLLQLLYRRSKQLYIQHLVFSLNMHSHMLFILTLLVISTEINMGFVNDIIETVLIFVMPVYIVIAMRKFYKQKLFKTIVKFAIISIVYGLLVAAAATGLAAFTAWRMGFM